MDSSVEVQREAFPTIYLQDSPMGSSVEIVVMDADKKVIQRLNALGLFSGTIIKKLSQAPFHGPIQIEVRGTRIVLGPGLAARISVRLLSPECGL